MTAAVLVVSHTGSICRNKDASTASGCTDGDEWRERTSRLWQVIQNLDMLSTGIKTPVGIKIAGSDLATLQRIGEQVEAVVRRVPGTLSAFAERVVGGNYIDFTIDRDEIARYGLTVGDVQDVIASAIGGMNVSSTVEGLERYPINLRYPRELRDNLDMLGGILVPTPMRQHIPLAQLATLEVRKGEPSIKSENSRPNTWIYVDIRDVDVGTYVAKAQRAVADAIQAGEIDLPAGYNIFWSGEYEYMLRAQGRLLMVVPITILVAQRAIAWKCADSLSVRAFLGLEIAEEGADHSSLTRICKGLPLAVHVAVFTLVLEIAREKGMLRGKTIAVDATMLEANAAMKAMVRRVSGEDWKAYLRRLAKEAGIEDANKDRGVRRGPVP